MYRDTYLASLLKPLRELTRKNSLFEWTSECEDASLNLKDSLTSDAVMSYFNPKLETELVVDASPHGVGAILTQIQPRKNGHMHMQPEHCTTWNLVTRKQSEKP